MRETAEETGLERLVLQGPIRVIDWHFRFRGRHIHKYCHFFLFESPDGEPSPQRDEGITDCQWRSLEEALEMLSYDNARGVLKRAGEMVRTLVAVGAGRSRPPAERRAPRADRGRHRRAAGEPRPRCSRSAATCPRADPGVVACRTPARRSGALLERAAGRRHRAVLPARRSLPELAGFGAPARHPGRGLRAVPAR